MHRVIFVKILRLKKSVILLLLLSSCIVVAQTTRKYSNEFMNIGVDAAALGMANAVVAYSGDVNSGYWNPAGIVQLEDNQIALMHSSYFANIANYNYAAYAMPLDDRSAVGISIIRFGVDDILDTTLNYAEFQGKVVNNMSDYARSMGFRGHLPQIKTTNVLKEK